MLKVFLRRSSHKVNILVITKLTIQSFIISNNTFHLTSPALNHPSNEQGGEYVDGGGEEGGDDAGGKEGQKSSACSLEETIPEKEKERYFACIVPPRHGCIYITSVPDATA